MYLLKWEISGVFLPSFSHAPRIRSITSVNHYSLPSTSWRDVCFATVPVQIAIISWAAVCLGFLLLCLLHSICHKPKWSLRNVNTKPCSGLMFFLSENTELYGLKCGNPCISSLCIPIPLPRKPLLTIQNALLRICTHMCIYIYVYFQYTYIYLCVCPLTYRVFNINRIILHCSQACFFSCQYIKFI